MSPKDVFERLERKVGNPNRRGRPIKLTTEEGLMLLTWQKRTHDLFQAQAVGFVNRYTGEEHATIAKVIEDYLDRLAELLDS